MLRPRGPLIDDFIAPQLPGPDVITGRTVTLERLDPDRHAAAIFAATRGDAEIWDYMGYGPFADAQTYTDWQRSVAAKPDPCFYAFVPHAAGTAQGLGAFMRIEPAHGAIEIGHIAMAPVMQRSTAASEAIMVMVGWAFDAGYRRVEWKCDALNAPSRRAAERFGFSFEGVFRQHMIVKGRSRDTAWFAITSADWPAIRARWQAWLAPGNFDADGRQIRALNGAD